MNAKKECVAMLLAGGQGSRLYTLTEKTAKPAVPFGGKYRIIDFPLSNCINSGIDTVGVLTQYQPLVLNDYIGNGQPWDLDRNVGGVMVLPPYQRQKSADWYSGTANAIYQNLNFIDRYNPDYVLILSGDHIYKMDYNKMLQYHKETGADCTIAVFDVPLSEASRFGIMNTDDAGRIVEFEEKPKQPKSTHASMGIYIFSADVLREYLERDEADEKSAKDFGKNIIPNLLHDGKKMYAYTFSGYWKDVGTIGSLWSANMDLLGEAPAFNLNEKKSPIYYRHTNASPQFIGGNSKISDALISEGCRVDGTVKHSVLYVNATVEKDATVEDSVIMSGAVIRSGAVVSHCIVDENAEIGPGACIGDATADENSITVIGADLTIPEKATVEKGQLVNGAWLREHGVKTEGGNN